MTKISDNYNINDVVGKSGIEAYMETTLQGTKGYEKVVVDNMGKVACYILLNNKEQVNHYINKMSKSDVQFLKSLPIYNLYECKDVNG